MMLFYLFIPFLTAVLGVLDLLLFQKTIGSGWGDILAAFPIAKEAAKPGMYSSLDLLVSSAKNIPFHLYKFAGILIQQGVDIEKYWFVLTILVLFSIFVALWLLSYFITDSYFISTISTLIIVHSYGTRGTLNWSFFPPTTLISSTFAMPFAIASLILFLKKKHLLALMGGAITYNLHPFGLVIYVLVVSYLLFISSMSVKRKCLYVLASTLMLSPTFIFTFKSLPSNFSAVSISQLQTYLNYYHLNAYHAYIEDHFKDGYGWFFIHLMGSFYFLRNIKSEIRKLIYWIFFVFFVLIIVYITNLYIFQIIPITLLYLFRVTYLLKPIMYSLVIYGSFSCIISNKKHFRHYTIRYLSIVMLVVSFFWPDIFMAETMGIFGYFLVLLNSRHKRYFYIAVIGIVLFISTIILQPYIPSFTQSIVSLGYIIYSIFILITIIFYPPKYLDIRTSVYARYQIKLSLILIIAMISGYISLYGFRCFVKHICISAYTNRWTRFGNVLKPENKELIEWVMNSTKNNSLFLIPPVDSLITDNIFQQFRLVAERGVYFSYYDVNQLAYDVKAYLETYRRFQRLGYRPIARHKFYFSSYNDLSDNDLLSLNMDEGVDYAIFVIDEIKVQHSSVVFNNNLYQVVDIGKIKKSYQESQ